MKTIEEIDLFVRHLSDDEIEVLKYFHTAYNKGDTRAPHGEWPRLSKRGGDHDGFFRAYNKFTEFDLFKEGYGSNEDDYITSEINPLIHRVNNPPLPNHWQNLLDWWFSRYWSLPVTLLIVVVPILAGWTQAVAWLVGWFSSP